MSHLWFCKVKHLKIITKWAALRKKVPNVLSRCHTKRRFFEPTCANARWALMHHFLFVCLCEIVCHRSKAKVSRSKRIISRLGPFDMQVMLEVKSHMGQGPRSHGSRSKVTLVKVSLKVILLSGGLTSTSSCIVIFF